MGRTAPVGVAFVALSILLYTWSHSPHKRPLRSTTEYTFLETPDPEPDLPPVPQQPSRQALIKTSGVLGTIALAALPIVLPRIRRNMRVASARRRRQRLTDVHEESFAQTLNLTKAELANAVFSGRMFNQTIIELGETIPIVVDTLQTCLNIIGNWTKYPDMGPADTAISKAFCALDRLQFFNEFAERRITATEMSCMNMINVARHLNLSGLAIDCTAAKEKLHSGVEMMKQAGQEIASTSCREELVGFLTSAMQEVDKALQPNKGVVGENVQVARLNQHTTTSKALAMQRIGLAMMYLRRMESMRQQLMRHVDLKESWGVDRAAETSPIETREYVKSHLTEAAEHIACMRRGVLEGSGPRWFTAGLAIIERINYYEGQVFMNLGGVSQNMEALSYVVTYLQQAKGEAAVRSVQKELVKLNEILLDARKMVGSMASHNHRRCVISMEVVLADGQNRTVQGQEERAAWYQESASHRLVTSDEDAEQFYDAANDVMQLWPEARSELHALKAAFPL